MEILLDSPNTFIWRGLMPTDIELGVDICRA
jgi:hypothetical protein